MLKRILTPFFPLPREEKTPAKRGQKAPWEASERMIGKVVGEGRYLIRRQLENEVDSIRFAAHDLIGNIEVSIDLCPDGSTSPGYRLHKYDAIKPHPTLPNLYSLEFTQEHVLPDNHPIREHHSGIWGRICAWFFRQDS